MKKAILAGAFALASATVASAQNAAYNWTGLYVGASAGYGWGDVQDNISKQVFAGGGIPAAPLDGPVAFGGNANGAIGGFQAGYNYQVDRWVLGIEASWSLTDSRRNYGCNASVSGSGAVITGSDCFIADRMKSVGDVRARFGTAFGRSLVYAAGGYALGDFSFALTPDAAAVGFGAVNIGASTLRSGWTIGGGIENALTDNIIVGLDYKYYDFGTWSTALLAGAAAGFTATNYRDMHFTENALQMRMSYKFGAR